MRYTTGIYRKICQSSKTIVYRPLLPIVMAKRNGAPESNSWVTRRYRKLFVSAYEKLSFKQYALLMSDRQLAWNFELSRQTQLRPFV